MSSPDRNSVIDVIRAEHGSYPAEASQNEETISECKVPTNIIFADIPAGLDRICESIDADSNLDTLESAASLTNHSSIVAYFGMGKPAPGLIVHDPLPPIPPQPYVWPRARSGGRSQRRVTRRSVWVIAVQKELGDCHIVWDVGQRSMVRMKLEDILRGGGDLDGCRHCVGEQEKRVRQGEDVACVWPYNLGDHKIKSVQRKRNPRGSLPCAEWTNVICHY